MILTFDLIQAKRIQRKAVPARYKHFPLFSGLACGSERFPDPDIE